MEINVKKSESIRISLDNNPDGENDLVVSDEIEKFIIHNHFWIEDVELYEEAVYFLHENVKNMTSTIAKAIVRGDVSIQETVGVTIQAENKNGRRIYLSEKEFDDNGREMFYIFHAHRFLGCAVVGEKTVNRISLIRLFRNEWNLGLKEAKDWVEFTD